MVFTYLGVGLKSAGKSSLATSSAADIESEVAAAGELKISDDPIVLGGPSDVGW